SNASRTLLYDINKAEWSSELSEILGIDPTILPEVHPNATSEPFGTYKGVPIRGVLGDQQAALFGQNGYNSSEIKTTYGTGNFTLMNLGSNVKISDKGLLTTVAWQIDKNLTYAMEGSVFITGAAFQWLRDELQIINSYAEIDDYSNKIENSGGVYFVPAFVGLGAPYWDTSARGTITGLTRGTNKYHIVQATIDSVAYQTQDLLDTLQQSSGLKLTSMRVDGGLTKSINQMQKQANISQIKIEIPRNIETTALGAALMAGYNEIWHDFETLRHINPVETGFEPKISNQIAEKEYDKWKLAVKKSSGWI
ncbi:MAG: FGGY-family carbohydrate kinase, partial [Candidatus Heimdallarchaeota archaeon]|nr:FGGY-family carbohydrate kinase [Candidatus Heimdallarchaeota archaeon]